MDVTGDGSKVQCSKEEYYLGTWNVRSTNQGKLEMVKQETVRVTIDILGISELKWTRKGEFKSDDHFIYYCGQESLRRNRVALIVNKESPKCSTWVQSQKQQPVVDVTGDGSKVRCCKEQYWIGTWNVRSMNQGKLEVVKQEMARVNINILGISELKWAGMGEFNSYDHFIYYCGQESLRRNGVALIVNKRVQNVLFGCSLKNDRMISVHFQGKPFSVTVIQVYAPTTNAEPFFVFFPSHGANTVICKASPGSHFAFLHFFSMGMVSIPVSCTVLDGAHR